MRTASPLPQPANRDKESSALKPLKLPSGSADLVSLHTPPEHLAELFYAVAFLASFRPQLGLHSVDTSLKGLDRALAGR